MAKLENPVQLGVIGAPHGIKGEVRVKTFTDDPTSLGDYGPLTTEDGMTLTVQSMRTSKTVVIVRFKEVHDRNAAEMLNGKRLFVERSALPDDLEEEEFYHADLIGVEVRDEAGETIGRITAVQNFGAGDILEVRPQHGNSVFIPFTRLAVPAIDLRNGTVTVNREMAGLIDKPEDAELRERDEPEADAQ